MLNIVILSLIQGLTEFLPISSSGHLVILPRVMNFTDPGLAVDAFLHLGTLFSALIYFRKEVINLAKSLLPNGDKQERRLCLGIVLATIPAFAVGFGFKSFFATSEILRSVVFVAMTLAIGGVIMWYVDKRCDANSKLLSQVTLWQIFMIGCAQALALFPGVSRSGATIVASLLCGLNRSDSARFAFLVGLPAIAGAGLLAVKDLVEMSSTISFDWQLLGVGFVVSFVSGYLAIDFLIKFLRSKSLNVFVVYRIILAIILLLCFR